jgi:Zn finger protein HypA/HybF involved in hydrogenase expression
MTELLTSANYNAKLVNMEQSTGETERVRAMVQQALAEARTRGAARVTALHLVMYDRSPEALQQVREALALVEPGTPAQDARLVVTFASGRFICWDCCGLRYESSDEYGMCPNCGGEGIQVPPEITFALDHIEVA